MPLFSGYHVAPSVGVLHAATLAQCKPLASGLQFLAALLSFLAGLEAFCCRLVRHGHSAVTRDVFLGFFAAVLGCGRQGEGQGDEK